MSIFFHDHHIWTRIPSWMWRQRTIIVRKPKIVPWSWIRVKRLKPIPLLFSLLSFLYFVLCHFFFCFLCLFECWCNHSPPKNIYSKIKNLLFTAPYSNSFFVENFYQFISIWKIDSGFVAQGNFSIFKQQVLIFEQFFEQRIFQDETSFSFSFSFSFRASISEKSQCLELNASRSNNFLIWIDPNLKICVLEPFIHNVSLSRARFPLHCERSREMSLNAMESAPLSDWMEKVTKANLLIQISSM